MDHRSWHNIPGLSPKLSDFIGSSRCCGLFSQGLQIYQKLSKENAGHLRVHVALVNMNYGFSLGSIGWRSDALLRFEQAEPTFRLCVSQQLPGFEPLLALCLARKCLTGSQWIHERDRDIKECLKLSDAIREYPTTSLPPDVVIDLHYELRSLKRAAPAIVDIRARLQSLKDGAAEETPSFYEEELAAVRNIHDAILKGQPW